MNGCTIYVMKRDSLGGKAQVTGIDTKYVKEQIAVELGADMYLLVSPYKEINREPLWKRARRKLLIWEANARLWITSHAGHGQSDIRTRTPAPVTDAEFHGPLTLSSEPPTETLQHTVDTINQQAGSQDESIPPSVLCKHSVSLTEMCNACASPDCFWKCAKCGEYRFLGLCDPCKHVTEF